MNDRIARWIWWNMIRVMRRPSMKRLQTRWITALPKGMQPGAWQSLRRQNRWARRYGVLLLRLAVTMLFASVLFTVAFTLILDWAQAGAFQVPSAS